MKTIADLAAQALQGDSDADDLIIERDPEARRLYIAFDQAAKSDQTAALDGPTFDVNALTPKPSDATMAAYRAYQARIHQLATGD